jgi:hypothetical protein
MPSIVSQPFDKSSYPFGTMYLLSLHHLVPTPCQRAWAFPRHNPVKDGARMLRRWTNQRIEWKSYGIDVWRVADKQPESIDECFALQATVESPTSGHILLHQPTSKQPPARRKEQDERSDAPFL